jgi:FkbM family methyltransferase
MLSENAEHLLEARAWNGVEENLQVIQVAIGDSEGEICFDGFSAWGTVVSSEYGARAKTAISTSLDNFVRDRNISRVDFLKIDIEGSEFRALRGADMLIQRDLPDIIIEANVWTCGNNHYSYKELFKVLSFYGYRAYRIVNGRLRPWSIECCQEVLVADYFMTLKSERVITTRTSWTVSAMTANEQAESIIYQEVYGAVHNQYILVIADTLPGEVLGNPMVRTLLEKWSNLKDETVFAVLRAGVE